MLRAEAVGEKDWAKRVKRMGEALVISQSNRKLTVITKGAMKSLEKLKCLITTGSTLTVWMYYFTTTMVTLKPIQVMEMASF